MKTILAIDLGKHKSVFCRFDTGSLKTAYSTVKTSGEKFYEIFKDLDIKDSLVLFETGSQVGWIADMLREMGIAFKAADTNDPAWKWVNNQNKSDKNDALRLALMHKNNFFPEVYIPELPVRSKRSLIYYRQKIVCRMTRIKNSIRSLMTTVDIELPSGKSCWSLKHIELLKSLALPFDNIRDDEFWRGQLYMELEQYDKLLECLNKTTKLLDGLADKTPQIKLLLTVPGVGIRTAEALVAVIDDPYRFKSCRQVCNYVGFTPRRYQSGEMDRTGRISKNGNPHLRALLVQAAWISLRFTWANEIFTRVCRGSSKRRNIAIVAVARHILIRCWAMLRDNKPWQFKHQDCKRAFNN